MRDQLLTMAACFHDLSQKLGFLRQLHADDVHAATRLEAAQARACQAAKQIRLRVTASNFDEADPPSRHVSGQP